MLILNLNLIQPGGGQGGSGGGVVDVDNSVGALPAGGFVGTPVDVENVVGAF